MLRIKVLVVGCVTLVVLAICSASAAAYSPGGGNSASAPGQFRAFENCIENYQKQSSNGVAAGGGHKEGESAPTNCDHYWGAPGQFP